jgi:hypothetical protein
MTLLLSIFSALLWIECNFSVCHAMLYPGLALHQLTGLKNGLSSDKQRQTSCRPLHGGKCSHQHRDYCPGIQLAVLSCFDRLLLDLPALVSPPCLQRSVASTAYSVFSHAFTAWLCRVPTPKNYVSAFCYRILKPNIIKIAKHQNVNEMIVQNGLNYRNT